MRYKVPLVATVRTTIFKNIASYHLLETDKRFEETSCL